MTLDEIETSRDEGILTEKIVPIEEMFSAYPAAAVIPEADSLVKNGNPLKPEELCLGESQAETIRVYDSTGRFMGIYRYEAERQFFKPWKMFLNPEA